jgi:hypothetical protein
MTSRINHNLEIGEEGTDYTLKLNNQEITPYEPPIKKYQHNIYFYENGSLIIAFRFSFISTVSSAYTPVETTAADIAAVLKGLGFDNTNRAVLASGRMMAGSTVNQIIGVYGTSSYLQIIANNTTNWQTIDAGFADTLKLTDDFVVEL